MEETKKTNIKILTTDDQEYERVNECKYLATILTEDKDATIEIKQRMIMVDNISYGLKKQLTYLLT